MAGVRVEPRTPEKPWYWDEATKSMRKLKLGDDVEVLRPALTGEAASWGPTVGDKPPEICKCIVSNRHNVPFKIFGMSYDFHELFCECPPEAGYYAGARYYGPFNAADLKVRFTSGER